MDKKMEKETKITLSEKHKGILYICGAALGFAVMNLFVRLSGDVPTLQKCFFRNIVAALFAFFMMQKNNVSYQVGGKRNLFYLLIRSCAGLMGIVCNFYTVDHLPISDASMLNKLSPFFAMVFSIFVLKEMAGMKEWGIVALAFTGALFVIKPSFQWEVIPALFGTLGGACAGLAYTYVRKLGSRGVSGMFIVFFFSAFSSVVLLPNLLMNFQPMEWYQWLDLTGAGLAAMVGQICITTAYTKAPAKEISVFDYSQIIFAAILGFVFLGELPDGFSVVGYGIILVAAILKWKN